LASAGLPTDSGTRRSAAVKARRRRLASPAQPRAGLDGEHCRVPWEDTASRSLSQAGSATGRSGAGRRSKPTALARFNAAVAVGWASFRDIPSPWLWRGMARHALRGRDSLGVVSGSFSVCLLTVLYRGDTVNITSINQARLRMQPVGAKHPVEPVRRRACPRCHAFVDWQAADPAFSATAEYRICPECDGAVFIGWRSAEPSAPLGPLAPEVR